MNLSDLKFESEILKIYDNNLNRKSKAALISLFQDIPSNKADVINRQEIINALINNFTDFKNISSLRLDIEESSIFTDSIIGSHGIFIAKKYREIRLRFLIDTRYRSQLFSKSIQFLFVIKQLSNCYFSNIRIDLYKHDFREKLKHQLFTINLFKKFIEDENILFGNGKTKLYIDLLKLIYSTSLDGTLKTFWNNFFHFDAYLSVAETSIKLNFKPVSFSENQFDIENLYHPLISNPVKNSLNTTSNVILLTGANMSGKSTFFKALSICIYLGHLGFRVPAQKCSIPYFDDINIFLNSKDDLESGFSQFMFELNNLKQIVVNAENGQHVYAVIDEMFSGTNIDDASDMFEITIKGLTKYRHCYFFISTHFSHLESFVLSCGKNVSTYFLDAKMENQQPVYTFELKKGWSDQKLGKILFENHGLGKLLTT